MKNKLKFSILAVLLIFASYIVISFCSHLHCVKSHDAIGDYDFYDKLNAINAYINPKSHAHCIRNDLKISDFYFVIPGFTTRDVIINKCGIQHDGLSGFFGDIYYTSDGYEVVVYYSRKDPLVLTRIACCPYTTSKPSNTPSEPITNIDDPSANLITSLTKEQKRQFTADHLIDQYGLEYRSLEIAKKLGKTDGCFNRMTRQEAKKIIRANKENGREAIFKAFVERQPYPDIHYQSGLCSYTYFTNDEETEWIEIALPDMRIDYVYGNERIRERLYDPRNE